MNTILDYVAWRGDIPFHVSPFNEVDNLLLAELSFLDLEGIVPPPELSRGVPLKAAAEANFARHAGEEIDMGVLVPDRIPDLLCAMADSARFSGILLNCYTQRFDALREQQFAAISFDVGDGSVYVAFRGTDDTLVGWKEDLNLGFMERIPSQDEALRYLTRTARQYAGKKLRVGGHSKGGNLAVFSAVHAVAEVQDRILAVYNNDGPGFFRRLIGTPEHDRVAGRILTLVPQASVVGQLLEHEESVQVVRSCAEGVMQHDGFSWEVERTRFVHLDDFSAEGKLIGETMEAWADSLQPAQREAFADALYEVLSGTGAKTLSDLSLENITNAAALLKKYQDLDRETRKALTDALWMLVQIVTKNIAQSVEENTPDLLSMLRGKGSKGKSEGERPKKPAAPRARKRQK